MASLLPMEWPGGGLPVPNIDGPSTITGTLLAIPISIAMSSVVGLLTNLGGLASTAIKNEFPNRCRALASGLHGVENTTVWFAEHVHASNLSLPDNNATCGTASQVVGVDFCRVALHVNTSDASGISMEAWLPEIWTGRFLSTGNGGLAGCIDYSNLAYAAELGFAAVGANNGHNGTSGGAFYNSPQVLTDFAWRSVHTGVVVGKQITAQLYGRPHNHSYYLGCSTGGRQGFKSAQSFPDDFDGLVVGAPAISWNGLMSWGGHFFPLTGPPNASSFVSADLWAAVHQDILAQCDALDSHVDGILEDPLQCGYQPDALLCPSLAANGTAANATNATSTGTCLTAAQAATVRAVFSPLLGADGALVYPRMAPGLELLGAISAYYDGAPWAYTVDWFRDAIYNDQAWDPATLGPADYATAAAKDPGGIDTWDGDLARARDRGAKILHYHGQADPVIRSDNSPRYYDHVVRTMGPQPAELGAFYRLFRISDMGHCAGGPGATFIGNRAAATASLDPEQNVLMAVVRWVENGTAPDTILGTAYVNGTREGEVAFRRRHCRYPFRNRYTGRGDPASEDSWECMV